MLDHLVLLEVQIVIAVAESVIASIDHPCEPSIAIVSHSSILIFWRPFDFHRAQEYPQEYSQDSAREYSLDYSQECSEEYSYEHSQTVHLKANRRH